MWSQELNTWPMHAEFRFDDNFTPMRSKLGRAFLQLTNVDFQK